MNQGQHDNQKLFIEIMSEISGQCPPGDQEMPGELFVSSLLLHPRMGTSIGVQEEKGEGGLLQAGMSGEHSCGSINRFSCCSTPRSAREVATNSCNFFPF